MKRYWSKAFVLAVLMSMVFIFNMEYAGAAQINASFAELIQPAASGHIWTPCTLDQNGFCKFSGTRLVRYGTDSRFNYWTYGTFNDSVLCDRSSFVDPVYPPNPNDIVNHGDPIPHMSKRCEYDASDLNPQWQYCANEGGGCTFSGTRLVIYGSNGKWTYATLTGGVNCNNSVFGDPAIGDSSKTCWYYNAQEEADTNWNYCAAENSTCRFSGDKIVMYGAAVHNLWAIDVFRDGVECTNYNFGDPDYGTSKACYYASSSISWRYCAGENEFCGFFGSRLVKYGSYYYWHSGTYQNGVLCSNSVFGDPVFGTPKTCYFADHIQ
ncbi:MAG: hypothetical protein HQL06_02135 [Nitrospirae bacterium]|nr:hypothetical protein [Nitrospirota bacterium]